VIPHPFIRSTDVIVIVLPLLIVILFFMMNIRIVEILAAIGTAVLSATYVWTQQHYKQIANEAANSNPALPRYLGKNVDEPSFLEKLQCVLLHVTTKWTRRFHKEPYALVAEPHRYITGLKRTRAARKNEVSNVNKGTPSSPIVIGTIRTYRKPNQNGT